MPRRTGAAVLASNSALCPLPSVVSHLPSVLCRLSSGRYAAKLDICNIWSIRCWKSRQNHLSKLNECSFERMRPINGSSDSTCSPFHPFSDTPFLRFRPLGATLSPSKRSEDPACCEAAAGHWEKDMIQGTQKPRFSCSEVGFFIV